MTIFNCDALSHNTSDMCITIGIAPAKKLPINITPDRRISPTAASISAFSLTLQVSVSKQQTDCHLPLDLAPHSTPKNPVRFR